MQLLQGNVLTVWSLQLRQNLQRIIRWVVYQPIFAYCCDVAIAVVLPVFVSLSFACLAYYCDVVIAVLPVFVSLSFACLAYYCDVVIVVLAVISVSASRLSCLLLWYSNSSPSCLCQSQFCLSCLLLWCRNSCPSWRISLFPSKY